MADNSLILNANTSVVQLNGTTNVFLNITKLVGYYTLLYFKYKICYYLMQEKYLTIIYNIYNFRYILNTGKILKLNKVKPNIKLLEKINIIY